jgi:hypothetical protein
MPDPTTPDPTQAYSLLPWVRRGIASQITGTPAVNYATIPLSLSVNGNPVGAPPHVRLPGPGDVKSIDARAFIRTDPRDGADNFEPNYLATVDLATPDLPWMLTPSANSGDNLRPWICLIVLPDGPGVSLVPSSSGPATLTVSLDPKTELPDLSQVDAWAHAQIAGTNLSAAALNGDSGSTLSRLVAWRRLEPSKRYVACVVPTFRAGVHAGLGMQVDDNELAPAWDASTTAPFTLPVYFSFRFQTGPGGDFASLARKIGPPIEKISAGTRTIDVSEPGFGLVTAPGVTLELEGALRTYGMGSTSWPGGAQATYEAQLRKALASAAAADPVVSPPVYGQTQTNDPLPQSGQPPVWLGELNLDPRTRLAASAGGQVVQNNAEPMVASAWNQLGEIRKANQLLRQAQLAREVTSSINRRHLQTIPGDGSYLQITSPTHRRISLTLAGVTATLSSQIRVSCVPSGAVSASFRSLARPRGPLGRQLAAKGPQQIVERLNLPTGTASTAPASSPLTVSVAVRAPQGMVTLDSVSPSIQFSKVNATTLAAAGGWKKTLADTTDSSASATILHGTTTTTTTGGDETGTTVFHGTTSTTVSNAALVDWKSDQNVPTVLQSGIASMPAPFVFPSEEAALAKVQNDFRGAAAAINGYMSTTDPPAVDPPSLGGSPALSSTRAALSAAFNPETTFRARFGARVPLGSGPDPLQPLAGAPQFSQAMYEPLAAKSPEWMLPGISTLPKNSAILLKTNPQFVEAYMVGLNEEFSRELLWRQYPAERTQTWFQNFWNAWGTPDIPAIAKFDRAGHLGDHTQDHAEPGRLALLIRADLFRRYPNVLVSACQAVWNGNVRALGPTRQWPIFQGHIGEEFRFFGFDIDDPFGLPDPAAKKPGYYFVLEEHITEPRFGLEPAASIAAPAPGTSQSWNDLSWDKITTPGSFLVATAAAAPTFKATETVAWGDNAAAMAFILMRRPVRVAMHATALVAAEHS